MNNISKEQRLIDIEKAFSDVIVGDSEAFSEYSKYYWYTSEDLKSLFDQLKLRKYQDGLSVLSSGDHIFNMIYKGITRIDTFDTNRLTEYYALVVKKPAIQSLNYDEYNRFFTTSSISSLRQDCFRYILSNAEEEYRTFWEELSYKYKYFCNAVLLPDVLAQSSLESYNSYDATSISYNKTKKRLKDATITFQPCNIKDIPDVFGTYDFIELSNILNYYHEIFGGDYYRFLFKRDYTVEMLKKKRQLIEKIYQSNLRDSGEMLCEYFYAIDGPGSGFSDNMDRLEKKYCTNKLDKFNPKHYSVQEGFVLSLKK